MKIGDVFELNEGEVSGNYSRWGKEENKEEEIEPLPHGTYYIREETEKNFLIAEVFGSSEFKVLGQKHSYYVSKESLEKKVVSYTIPKEKFKEAKK